MGVLKAGQWIWKVFGNVLLIWKVDFKGSRESYLTGYIIGVGCKG